MLEGAAGLSAERCEPITLLLNADHCSPLASREAAHLVTPQQARQVMEAAADLSAERREPITLLLNADHCSPLASREAISRACHPMRAK